MTGAEVRAVISTSAPDSSKVIGEFDGLSISATVRSSWRTSANANFLNHLPDFILTLSEPLLKHLKPHAWQASIVPFDFSKAAARCRDVSGGNPATGHDCVADLKGPVHP
jgi:hypothetical protein